jgi:Fe2+ transport system protein FeoA
MKSNNSIAINTVQTNNLSVQNYICCNLHVMKRLSEIKQGKTVRIVSFDNADLLLKLMEMGCLPGEQVRIEQIAPLGDPISIGVAGYSLSLRLNEAHGVIVEELNN